MFKRFPDINQTFLSARRNTYSNFQRKVEFNRILKVLLSQTDIEIKYKRIRFDREIKTFYFYI